MRTPRPRWLRLPRRTARLRLTVRYGGAVFLACGATMLAVTYLFYGQLGNAPTLTRPVLHLYKQGKEIPIAAVQPAEATIRMTGLGQLSFDRQQLLIAAGIALAVIAVAAAAIGWLIAGQVLRPLRTITAAARRISASSLHERLALRGPDDELKELADTLDSLFERLETSFDAQRRFAASASHELRTPLTRERTLLQVTLAHPAPGHPRRPGRHHRHLAGRQPGTARLQRRAGTPHRSAAHPGQQRSRPRPARARRPGRHHQRSPGRRQPRDQPPRPERPDRHPARRPRL
jgi:signal transduction histidine kinase